MTFALIGLALLAALALSGWIMAEFELLDAHHELDEMQRDLDIATGWHEQRLQSHAIVGTTLHVVDGGES